MLDVRYVHMNIFTYVQMYICTYAQMYVTEHFRGHKLSPKGRTDMKIGRSRAKNYLEFHGNLRFCVAPQKPMKKRNKHILAV